MGQLSILLTHLYLIDMKKYIIPVARLRDTHLESRFLIASPWYDKTGEDFGGDFDFTVEDDETWG